MSAINIDVAALETIRERGLSIFADMWERTLSERQRQLVCSLLPPWVGIRSASVYGRDRAMTFTLAEKFQHHLRVSAFRAIEKVLIHIYIIHIPPVNSDLCIARTRVPTHVPAFRRAVYQLNPLFVQPV